MKKSLFEYKELGEQVMIENAMSDIIAEYMIENEIGDFDDLTDEDFEQIEENFVKWGAKVLKSAGSKVNSALDNFFAKGTDYSAADNKARETAGPAAAANNAIGRAKLKAGAQKDLKEIPPLKRPGGPR